MDEANENGHAARMRRMRDKQADAGLKSINIVVPIIDHEHLKGLAKRLVKGEKWAEAILATLPPRPPKPPILSKKLLTIDQVESKQLADAAYKSTGWKRMILRWLFSA